jgi:hypothetical protein
MFRGEGMMERRGGTLQMLAVLKYQKRRGGKGTVREGFRKSQFYTIKAT